MTVTASPSIVALAGCQRPSAPANSNQRSSALGVSCGGSKPAGPCGQRSRQLFYDPDCISENQEETIQICDQCGGSWKIDSTSDRGRRILAIHIPRQACPDCRETGQDWFEEADKQSFDLIALQDQSTDTYTVKPS